MKVSLWPMVRWRWLIRSRYHSLIRIRTVAGGEPLD
jgi:hypothetical protein